MAALLVNSSIVSLLLTSLFYKTGEVPDLE
jgi:hypothetical protein